METIALEEPRSLPELLVPVLQAGFPNALAERSGHRGAFVALDSRHVLERAQHVALGLRALGLAAGDHVGILSPNCVAWVIADLGIQLAGMVSVPILPGQAPAQAAAIVRHAQLRALFLHDARQRESLLGAHAELPATFLLSGSADQTFARLERMGAERAAAAADELAHLGEGIAADALCTLIYTSGTTGEPKGVMLTQRNLISNVVDVFRTGMIGVTAGDPVLSVLPLAHAYERTIVYGYLWWRCAVTICRGAEELAADLRSVRPAMMTAVPRIFERMLATLVGRAQGRVTARLVPWTLAVGREHARRCLEEGRPPGAALRLSYAAAHALMLRRLRPLMGLDRLRFFVSGGAPLHVDTALTFAGFDVAILQGYGLTEASPVVSMNVMGANRWGSAGRVIPHVEVDIAEDGEILVRGPNVMRGYYRDDAATAQTLIGGWLHTGDLGRFDADGYLYVTGRKKDLFKTSGGTYISPEGIETALERSIYVANAVVVGEGRPHPAVLIAPDWPLVRRRLGIRAGASIEALAGDERVRRLIAGEIRNASVGLAPFEQVRRRFAVLPRELTIAGGELSPTLKARRQIVVRRYAPLIEGIYSAAMQREECNDR